MRTIEEIKRDVIELVTANPEISEREIGTQLHLSARYTKRLLNEMIKRGEICLN